MRKYLEVLSNILIAVSIIFLVVFFFTNDDFDDIVISLDIPFFIISILVLMLPIFIGVYVWFLSLRQYSIKVPFRYALASHGLSIFSKYIPGRVWTTLSRSAFISKLGHPIITTSFISARLQVFQILIGILVGAVPMMLLEIEWIYRLLILAVVFVVLFVLVNESVQKYVFSLVNKITKNKIDIENISFKLKDSFFLIAVIFAQWVLYSLAYFFFIKSLTGNENWLLGFALPLSMNLGLISFITPGGLGVREGVMVAYFILFGVDTSSAAFVSILSRIWFFLGEGILFISGLIVNLFFIKKKS